jgi:type VI protein secretion system component VasK
MKRVIALSVAIVTFSTFAFAACGDDSSSVSDDAAQLCSDVAALNSTVQGITGQDLDLKTTPVSDVQDMITGIQSQVQAISSSKSALSDQVKSDLKDAYDQFKSDLAAAKDAGTLQEAGQQLETARTNFRDAWEGILAQVNCAAATTG